MPGVTLYYALKPLPHPAVVAELRDLGACFDVATAGEIRLVRGQGVSAERCIQTHPIKSDAEIRAALRFGIRTFVVDNPDEIRKFVRYRRRATLLLRVSFRNPAAVVDLSRKFGCEPVAARPLLSLARSLGVGVSGLSFHVGSQVADPGQVRRGHRRLSRADRAGAARRRRRPRRRSTSAAGFPVSYRDELPSIRRILRAGAQGAAIAAAQVRVIAEPGRYISAPAGTAASSVVGRSYREGRWWYYLDDGLYGSYSGQLFDHMHYPVEALDRRGPRHPCVLAGPTCDSIDVIHEDLRCRTCRSATSSSVA